jgi:hypothetical protein
MHPSTGFHCTRLHLFPTYTLCLPYKLRFAVTVQEKDEVELRPVFTEDGYTFVYIKVQPACVLFWLLPPISFS